MDDDGELLRVNPTGPSERAGPKRMSGHGSSDHHERHEAKHRFRRSGDYLHTLAKAAEETNRRFERKGVPFRFCVYRGENERVMLDFAELDGRGEVKRVVRRDITDEDFDRWIEDIANGEGLMLDSLA